MPGHQPNETISSRMSLMKSDEALCSGVRHRVTPNFFRGTHLVAASLTSIDLLRHLDKQISFVRNMKMLESYFHSSPKHDAAVIINWTQTVIAEKKFINKFQIALCFVAGSLCVCQN